MSSVDNLTSSSSLNQQADLQQKLSGKELRRWTRYKSELSEVTVILENNEQVIAEVHDESFGGIGIILPVNRSVEANTNIKMLYAGAPVHGNVRWTKLLGEGKLRIGIAWADRHRDFRATPTNNEPKQAVPFVRVYGLPMRCNLITNSARIDQPLQVRLPDGSNFMVLHESIAMVEEGERLDYLRQTPWELNLLLALYELGQTVDQDDAIKTIITYEYSTMIPDSATTFRISC